MSCSKMSNCVIFVLYAILLLQDFSHSLRLVEVRIPNYVIKGSAAQLECLYDLDGEYLYSVKWYKDGNEFYRYVPRDMPPAQTFLLPGVSVDVHNSSDAIVTLREVNLQSAGRFRCEVSGEAPSFQTVTEHGDMVVVSLPDQGPPKITGGRPRYQIGDNVRINCTAGRSKPAVQLSWFVNGQPAEPRHVRKYDTIVSGREGLETSVLGLQFRVEQHHFRNGDMKLKCVAALSTFYWRSNEESVEGDRPQKAPVLESRETVYASNSRADPVQANKTDSALATIKPSTLVLLIAMALITTSGCFEQLHLVAMKATATRRVTTTKTTTTQTSTATETARQTSSSTKCQRATKCQSARSVTEMTNKSCYDCSSDSNKVKAKKLHEPEEGQRTGNGKSNGVEAKEMHYNKEMSSLSAAAAMPTPYMHALKAATSVSCTPNTVVPPRTSFASVAAISQPSCSVLAQGPRSLQATQCCLAASR